MITKFNKFNLITENPDTVWEDDKSKHYYCKTEECIPFLSDVNADHTKVEKMYFGKPNSYHEDIRYTGGIYPGRVWLDNKIMAFWVYPNDKLFKSMVKYIERELNIKIFNNGWRIEVFKKDNNIQKKHYDPIINDYYLPDTHWDTQFNLIPIEQYAGSDDIPEELKIQHLMSWKEKELAKKMKKIHFKGIGSDKTAWDAMCKTDPLYPGCPKDIKTRRLLYQEKKMN